MADPFLNRRSAAWLKRARSSQTTTGASLPRGKDDVQASRDLAAINREYLDKEFSVASAMGPHSTPEQHYPKVLKALPLPEEHYAKKEDEDA